MKQAFFLAIILSCLSLFSMQQEQPLALTSADGATFFISPQLAQQVKTLVSLFSIPHSAEATTNQIHFTSVDALYLSRIVDYLKCLHDGITHKELVKRLTEINHHPPYLCPHELLSILTFLGIKKLKAAFATHLVTQQHEDHGNNLKTIITDIQSYPPHLQGILLKYWYLNFDLLLLPDMELRTVPGFSFRFNELPDFQKLSENQPSQHWRFSSRYLKNLMGINSLSKTIKAALETMCFNDNMLRIISPITDFTNLKELSLKNNYLTSIDPTAFDMPVLQKIDLSYNRLTTIPESLFYKTPLLEDIDLQNNEIELATRGPFQKLEKLCRLNLFDNPLDRSSKKDLAEFEDYTKNPCRVVLLDTDVQ